MIRYWTPFNGKPNNFYKDKPRITLNNQYVIMLNMKAFEMLGRPGAVEMFFDQTYGVIGIKPVRYDAHNAFPVIKALNATYRRINASPFCLNFKIRPERTMMFLEPFVNSEGIMELNLAKTMIVTRGSHASHGRKKPKTP